MNILDHLSGGTGAAVVDGLARAYGITPEEARRVLESVVPQLAERIERNTLSRGGIADMVGALGYAQRQDYLSSSDRLASDAVRRDGIAFLDQILWSKDRSRSVAHRAAASSGVSEEIVKAMLPSIAAAMMGGLAKASSGGLADILSKIPGLPGADVAGRGGFGNPGGRASGPLGGPPTSGPMPMPGGSAGGGVGQQAPLPIPGGLPGGGGYGGGWGGGQQGQSPYGDLSDIIRKGGQSVPGAGGGGLSGIIRSILGAALGFQNRGVLSWIIRYVVLRYGWSILRGLLSVVLGRRM